MKKVKFFFVLFLGVQSFLWSNPIDGSAKTIFSELVFDVNNNWTLELIYSTGYEPFYTDSVIVTVSNVRAKLLVTYWERNHIYVITQDSLSIPLQINREGDKIEIETYCTSGNYQEVRNDYLIFGNYPEATVGSPMLGYSTICRIQVTFNYDSWSLNCLSKNSSLGVINSSYGLSANMSGRIYDMNDNPVTQIKSPYYLILETHLNIDPNGNYTTQVYRTFPKVTKDYLYASVQNIQALWDTTQIEPIELNDIHPDSLIIQDIHLKSNKYVVTSIEENEPLRSEEFILINYPNPFNLSTNFFVKVPERMKEKTGVINIYNSNGELIRAIQFDNSSTVSWDGEDGVGNVMPSGIYLYQLDIDKQMMKSGSMILLK